MESPGRLEPGRVIGGYRIERFLNEGGMGTIYLATQLSMGRRVALKVLSPAFTKDAAQVEAFAREARTLAVLDHANVITAFDVGREEGVDYLAMAYFDGTDLSARVHQYGPIPERRALAIALKCAQALDYGWEKFKLLHLDIKPGNIMVNNEGEVRLLDLGLAKQTRGFTGLDMQHYFEGTPLYASPEQLRGATNVDNRADIFALGATLYYMVTGVQPYSQYSGEALFRKHALPPMKNAHLANPKVSHRTARYIAKMMEHGRMKRPGSWKDVMAAFEQLLAVPAKAKVVGWGRTTAPPKRIPVKPAAAARAGARTVRAPRKAAQKPGTPVMPALVVAALLAGSAYILLKKVRLVPPGGPGSGPAAQALVEQDQAEAQRRALRDRLAELRLSVAARPTDVEGALAAYQELLDDAGDDPVAESIRAEIATLTIAHAARERAQEAGERAELEELARERMAASLCGKLAGDLLAFDLDAARARLAAATNSEVGAGLEDVLAEYRDIVDTVENIPALIIESFSADVGRMVAVGLKSGKASLTIRSIGNGSIIVASEIRHNREVVASSERAIHVSDLSVGEMVSRLTRANVPHTDLLKGLLAYRAREETASRNYFGKVDTDLGRALLARVVVENPDRRKPNRKGQWR